MKHVVGLLIALLVTAAASVPVFAQGPLSDVPTTHWAYQAVDKLASSGILEGYPDGTFKGNRALTRYEFAMAIARMLQYGDENWAGDGAAMKGEKGDPGDPGKDGAPGPPGPKGDPGVGAVTAEQQKLLDQLKNEFMPELKELSVMLYDLERRVEDLEDAPAAEPRIKVSGNLSYRMGWYGTKIRLTHGETTGYPLQTIYEYMEEPEYPNGYGAPAAQFNGDGDLEGLLDDALAFLDFWSNSIFVADGLKDASKASDFGTLRTQVDFSGDITDDCSVLVSMVAEPRTNYTFSNVVAGPWSPNFMYSNGVMDNVRIDQAWAKFPTAWILQTDWTVGKQYYGVGQGLLFNNNQFGLKGVKGVSRLGGNMTLTTFGAQLDREAFASQTTGPVAYVGGTTWGQDTYLLGRLDVPIMGWDIGANWLQTGFADEQGWSIDAAGKLLGRPVAVEYATMLRSVGGIKEGDWSKSANMGVDDNTALIASLGLIDNASFALSGRYGAVEPLYAFSVAGSSSAVPGYSPLLLGNPVYNLPLSLLHPYTEFSAHDINWVDRPLFLDATNVARGWEVNLTLKRLLGSDMPLSIRYYDGDAYCNDYVGWLVMGGEGNAFNPFADADGDAPAKWRDADAAVVVSLTKPLCEGVDFTLLYGRREVKNVMRPNPYDEANYLADPIQVVRGELSVSF